MDVEEQDAKAMARTLAREEGICAGVSSGGAVFAALEIARQILIQWLWRLFVIGSLSFIRAFLLSIRYFA